MIIRLSEHNEIPVTIPIARPARRFALVGAAGYIAPRHVRAIHDTGNQLVAAVDPHDSVGMLDAQFPDCQFFTQIERFDQYLDEQNDVQPLDYISVCSPNYLHSAHIRLGLRSNANVICEKPLVVSPGDLGTLTRLENESERRVNTVLQLRLHPAIQALKSMLDEESPTHRRDICLSYVTRRGQWYHSSWKGSREKSGGLAMNIGVHFFDVLMWLFGPAEKCQLQISRDDKMAGQLELERARVRWFLSIDREDLPAHVQRTGGFAYRSLTVDGHEVDFSGGFNDLHTAVYRQILAGEGYGIQDARPAIELVDRIRRADYNSTLSVDHPLICKR